VQKGSAVVMKKARTSRAFFWGYVFELNIWFTCCEFGGVFVDVDHRSREGYRVIFE
jgi:hypothetical protein|tara:strand:- start:16 stop:183 length:168 start_codon:yes stop_codon:yes gene_type:complete